MCHLVATLDNEMEFEIVNTDRVKCVTLRLEFSVHSSRNYSQLSDWRLHSIYQFLNTKSKYLKYLETSVVQLLYSLAITYIKWDQYLFLALSWTNVWLNWSMEKHWLDTKFRIRVNSTMEDWVLMGFEENNTIEDRFFLGLDFDI